jgi:hypothetical protein
MHSISLTCVSAEKMRIPEQSAVAVVCAVIASTTLIVALQPRLVAVLVAIGGVGAAP